MVDFVKLRRLLKNVPGLSVADAVTPFASVAFSFFV